MTKEILQFLSNHPEGITFDDLVSLVEGQTTAGAAGRVAGLIREGLIQMQANGAAVLTSLGRHELGEADALQA